MNRNTKTSLTCILVLVAIILPTILISFTTGGSKISEKQMVDNVRFLGYNNKRPPTYTFAKVSNNEWFEVNYSIDMLNKNDTWRYKPHDIICISYSRIIYDDGRIFNRLNNISKKTCEK